MLGREQRSLVLIIAREFASHLATPVFLVDREGTVVFFNEAAEHALGRSWAESGSLTREEWSTIFLPQDADGNPLPPEGLPLNIALAEMQPSHRTMQIVGLDGVRRSIAVTAFPLFTRADEFEGALAIFWEDGREPTG